MTETLMKFGISRMNISKTGKFKYRYHQPETLNINRMYEYNTVEMQNNNH